MSRKRKRGNEGLPLGWRRRYGTYYYQVPEEIRDQWDGKVEFRLGRTLAEAHETFARRIGYEGDVNLMEQLCDRYTLEIIPTKAAATRRSNQYSMLRIRKAFADNRVTAIQPVNIYAYLDHIEKTESPKKAALDHEVLSHMFTKAIRWGVISVHPMTDKKVEKPKTGKGRKVVPLEAEVVALANTMPLKWQLYLALKVWTSRRKGELLRMRKTDLLEEGMRFRDNKNPDNEFILPWEPETRAIVDQVLRLPGAIRSMYLFANRSGQPYINLDESSEKYGNTSGFDSIFFRYRNKALEKGVISVKFTEHDLRKVRPSQLSAEQAQELLQHTNPATTKKYRPGRKIVSLGEHK